jgi:hypothetical protein
MESGESDGNALSCNVGRTRGMEAVHRLSAAVACLLVPTLGDGDTECGRRRLLFAATGIGARWLGRSNRRIDDGPGRSRAQLRKAGCTFFVVYRDGRQGCELQVVRKARRAASVVSGVMSLTQEDPE